MDLDENIPDWVTKNNIPGWLRSNDLIALYQLSSSLSENAVIVEVGSFHGKSAVQLARSLSSGTIYCFDHWSGYTALAEDGITRENDLETFRHFTKEYKNIVSKKINHIEDADWKELEIDMLFIDASHQNPSDWEIIEYFMPYIKQNGILCGHDYYKERFSPDVNDNVDRLEEILKQKVTTYGDYSSVWSFRV